MLDIIFGASEQPLAPTGLMGFVISHWAVIAVVVMVLGFVIDQALYIVRYRPQDAWRERYYAFRRFLTNRFGVKPAAEPPREEDNPLMDTGNIVRMEEEMRVYRAPQSHAAPYIQRGGARQRPREAPSRRAVPPERLVPRPMEIDEDAPAVRRRSDPICRPAPRQIELQEEDEPVVVRGPRADVRRGDAEPTTLRPQEKSE